MGDKKLSVSSFDVDVQYWIYQRVSAWYLKRERNEKAKGYNYGTSSLCGMAFCAFTLIVAEIISLSCVSSVESYRNTVPRQEQLRNVSRSRHQRHQSHYFYNEEPFLLPGQPYPYSDLNFELAKCLNLR